jgi:hypothetical protein
MPARTWWLALLAAAVAAAQIPSAPIGHEYREDDLPAIAAAPDGSLWVAWLSFDGKRDDVAIRRYDGTRWSNIHWVPATSGDSWLPQAAVDAAGRVWVVWSQQEKGNWDICARRFDPNRQEWSALERLSTHPLPDINPRVWSDGKGRAALVWQGFRGQNSSVFLKTLEGDRWSAEVRVTNASFGGMPPWRELVAHVPKPFSEVRLIRPRTRHPILPPKQV